MKTNEINKLMQQVAEFLEYHSSVLENDEPYKRYNTAVTSISISFYKCSIQLNEEAFNRVIKNPKITTDYGCDPLGITTTVSSSKTMHCSFMWHDLEIMCVKDLDLSELTEKRKSKVGLA